MEKGKIVIQKRCDELVRHLEHIELSINKTIVPASCGHLFYELRLHTRFVRGQLISGQSSHH